MEERRVTTLEREAAVENLQAAYTRGQLEETELDSRIRQALDAKTQSDLTELLADLSAPVLVRRSVPGRHTRGNLNAHGVAVQKTGEWTVPSVLRVKVYKGSMILDLRRADRESEVLKFKISAYKGTVEIIVPRGYRIEMKGSAYKGHWDDLTEGALADAPLLTLKGSAYKGSVIVRNEASQE